MIYTDAEIMAGCLDEETGEFDKARFDEMQLERDEKLEKLILYYKDLTAESTAVKAESIKLKERADSIAKKAENIKAFVSSFLDGEKFKTSRCTVGWRKTYAVTISDELNADDLADRFKTVKIEVKPNKTELKEYLKNGGVIDGVTLEEKKAVQIK